MNGMLKVFSAIALTVTIHLAAGCDLSGSSGNTKITCMCDCASGVFEEAVTCGTTPDDIQPACMSACEELPEKCGFNNAGAKFDGPCPL